MDPGILVTAGPTIEPLDPVRYISNHSTGTMGYAIAKECARKGYRVTLVSGPASLLSPQKVKVIKVKTALEMKEQVEALVARHAVLIMAAAVSDFRAAKPRKNKIKKRNGLVLDLVENPDILTGLKGNKSVIKIGFALETEKPVENGKKKLNGKGLDMIVVNTVSSSSNPFGLAGCRTQRGIEYTVIDKGSNVKQYRKMKKERMARIVVREAERLLWMKD